MMTRNPEILFITEYIENELYFATVRSGKTLTNTLDAHYFCIDNELVYENYYSDFGPLNLGCVYKYCQILNEKRRLYAKEQIIIHYTSVDPRRKANAAFLLGCFGVLYMNMKPIEAIKPLMLNGQTYRPFQDATIGDSTHTITILDCLSAIRKARLMHFFDFGDFDYEEYQRLDKIQGGDLNWIVPGKYLAFIGPVDYSVSIYHPPEMYIDYFVANNVKIVIRLNKRMYDSKAFSNKGIVHYDLFFPDGSCPPRHVLFKFLHISEESDGAIAVHCKAGLGRTGSLIGCYLIKHYRMTAREAIGWMRICRPGSVIGHQQSWLEQVESWLTKQGNIYRKRNFQDSERFPIHKYGVYSLAEKNEKQMPLALKQVPSPPPPMQLQPRSDVTPPLRPQGSRVPGEKSKSSISDEEEMFITECDLTSNATVTSPSSHVQMKGCVIKNTKVADVYDDDDDPYLVQEKVKLWRKIICCQLCGNILWDIAVRCSRITPETWCSLHKSAASEEQRKWNMRSMLSQTSQNMAARPSTLSSQKILTRNDSGGITNASGAGRGFAAGEPRSIVRPKSPIYRSNMGNRLQTESANLLAAQKTTNKRNFNQTQVPQVPTYTTSQGPIVKTLKEARNYLIRTSMFKEQREKELKSALVVTPQTPHSQGPSPQIPHSHGPYHSPGNSRVANNSTPPTFYVPKGPTQPVTASRRRLGRSPSPSPSPSPTRSRDWPRATNTMATAAAVKELDRDASAMALNDVISRLTWTTGRNREGSVGATSLGAPRNAPRATRANARATSARSDEYATATQGDMLNSIKFQRQLRECVNAKTTNEGTNRPKTTESAQKPSLNESLHKANYNESVHKPSYNESEHKPSFIESIHKPSFNQCVHKPSYNESTHIPSYNESVHKAIYNESVHKPNYNESTHIPSYNESVHKAIYNESVHKPNYNESTHIPSYNESVHKPSFNESLRKPSFNKALQKPNLNESVHKPNYKESVHKPSFIQSIQKPSHIGSVHKPSFNESLHKPSFNESTHKTGFDEFLDKTIFKDSVHKPSNKPACDIRPSFNRNGIISTPSAQSSYSSLFTPPKVVYTSRQVRGSSPTTRARQSSTKSTPRRL